MNQSPPHEILERWFPVEQIISTRTISGGMSGAAVWKIDVQAPDFVRDIDRLSESSTRLSWALKCWPSGSHADRVAEIHSVLQHARLQNCPAIPKAKPLGSDQVTWLSYAGAYWECAEWIDGSPPNLHLGLDAIVAELAGWVARFSMAVAPLGSERGTPRTLLDRRKRFDSLYATLNRSLISDLAATTERCSVAERQTLTRAVHVLEWAWPQRSEKLLTQLNEWIGQRFPLQYVVRDVHFGNTLFDENRLLAFVDFDAVRIDTPAADLSRLVGSVLMELAGEVDEEHVWSVALAAYRTIRPFSGAEERLARWLAEINPLLNLANWVVWLVLEDRDFGNGTQMAFQRVEQWSAVVAGRPGVTQASPGW